MNKSQRKRLAVQQQQELNYEQAALQGVAAPRILEAIINTFRQPFNKVVEIRLFEVRFAERMYRNERIYKFLYENKMLVHADKKYPGVVLVYFQNKDEAKQFRDVLMSEFKDVPFHVNYGPDHRRVVGVA